MMEELSYLWGKLKLTEEEALGLVEINEIDVEDTMKIDGNVLSGAWCLVGKLLVERDGRDREDDEELGER
jgi:hypothetical protein